MKQIVVISGKGGTGKTTLTSSFAYLAKNRDIADCDVEAPNLNLILNNNPVKRELYIGGKIAYIDKEKCIECGKCRSICRFDAVKENFEINDTKCEGCGACVEVCPNEAIKLVDDETGDVITSSIEGGKFSYAQLRIGADGAGKVVTKVRQSLISDKEKPELVIIDGSPGIGCVVISSLTGCNMAVVVTEPTQSGLEDLMRVLGLVDYFRMKAYVVINKFDINLEKTKEIEDFCNENNFEVVGKIPFDPYVSKAIKESKPVVQFEESIAGKEIKKIWNIINEKIKEVE